MGEICTGVFGTELRKPATNHSQLSISTILKQCAEMDWIVFFKPDLMLSPMNEWKFNMLMKWVTD